MLHEFSFFDYEDEDDDEDDLSKIEFLISNRVPRTPYLAPRTLQRAPGTRNAHHKTPQSNGNL